MTVLGVLWKTSPTGRKLRTLTHIPKQELKCIRDYCWRNPNISICELYGKLREDTVDFVKRAIDYFGYAPKQLQTDNGAEFTNFSRTERVHILDKFCAEYGIERKLIRTRTPWHNGKVEHNHRSDQERFYNHLSFYSYDDILGGMKRYMRRSNRIPMTILGWKSHVAMHQVLETAFDR